MDHSNSRYGDYAQYILGHSGGTGRFPRPQSSRGPTRGVLSTLHGADEVSPTTESTRQVHSLGEHVQSLNTMAHEMSSEANRQFDQRRQDAAVNARLGVQAGTNNILSQQRTLHRRLPPNVAPAASQAPSNLAQTPRVPRSSTPPERGPFENVALGSASFDAGITEWQTPLHQGQILSRPPQASSARQPRSTTQASSARETPRRRKTTPESDWEVVTGTDYDATPEAESNTQVTPGIVAHLYLEAQSNKWVVESIGSRTPDGDVLAVGHMSLYFRRRALSDDGCAASILCMHHDGEEWAFRVGSQGPLAIAAWDNQVTELLEQIRNDLHVHVMVDCGGENWFMGPAEIWWTSKFRYCDISSHGWRPLLG